MTIQEAIKILKEIDSSNTDTQMALQMAIKVLEKILDKSEKESA